jgi:hypothetical protein
VVRIDVKGLYIAFLAHPTEYVKRGNEVEDFVLIKEELKFYDVGGDVGKGSGVEQLGAVDKLFIKRSKIICTSTGSSKTR